MTKYIITDPCYLLDDDTWQKCCNAAQLPSGEWNDDVFNAYVEDALKTLSGNKAWASSTGFGDWTNYISGMKNVLQPEFAADSGMVCVCEFNDKVEAAMHIKYPTGLGKCAAFIECEGQVRVDFDTEDKNWTVVYITDETTTFHSSYADDEAQDDDWWDDAEQDEEN